MPNRVTIRYEVYDVDYNDGENPQLFIFSTKLVQDGRNIMSTQYVDLAFILRHLCAR